MSTELARYQNSTSLTVSDMQTVGRLFKASGLFSDIQSEAAATVKVMAGQELGIPPFASMNGIHIIKGKAAIGANLIGATIKRSGKYDYIVREMTGDVCAIEFFQLAGTKRESIGVSSFTIAEARKAGTQNLDKFARNMLFARAISNGARWYTPDVFLGPIYVPEELGATVDGDGDVIDVQPVASFDPPAAQSAPVDPEQDERDQLIKRIKAIAPAAKALGVAFPDVAPKAMSLAELRDLYAICEEATAAVDK